MPTPSSTPPQKFRWHWRLRGQIQGVGFRPFIYRIARHAGITGRVLNSPAGVHLEIQGRPRALAAFAAAFKRHLPPLAQVDSCRRTRVPVIPAERSFIIDTSAGAVTRRPGDRGTGRQRAASRVDAAVTVDTAVCAECLREMLSPDNRRYLHALINCTNCGPRFSIIQNVPYDRQHTTMASFKMCPACRAEYQNPADRRFHAQPVCCPDCGPQVALVRSVTGRRGGSIKRIPGNPIQAAARLLLEGGIVALKGLGGFHLAVRADRRAAVERLRRLKQRDAKPFALMVPCLAAARALVHLSPAAEAELTSARAPIILASRKEAPLSPIAASVAPGTDLLGIMLPYTPLHHLLFRTLIAQHSSLITLVMTSGNLSNEPLVIDNADAAQRLGPICDAILWHDRPIERCVDDSVVLDRGPGRAVLPIRRSRGYVPGVWRLPAGAGAAGICLGGELKSTVAVVRGGGGIIVSQHLGDLTDARSYAHFQKAVEDLIRLFHIQVGFVAHDMHPAYMSTLAAQQLAERFKARLIPVQHHIAHAYGVMGEHGLSRALAIVCDGTGWGTDGTIWGGELFHIDGSSWERIGRLKPMRLVGGDAAARDPRRSGLALLHSVYGDGFAELPQAAGLFGDKNDREMLARMIITGLSSPWTSSTGRLFDGVSALLGICMTNEHEAQAAMALEAEAWRAERAKLTEEKLFEVRRNGLWELDLSAFVRRVVERKDGGSRLFHSVLARGLVAMAEAAGAGLPLVASGGSFCNRLLERELENAAADAGMRTYFHKAYPPTDAGLSFGQAMYSRMLLSSR